MESLRQQINPNLTAMPNPDQTFQQYIQMLLSQQPATQKGFSSAFVGTGQQATQPTGMQAGGGERPTTNITSGLFSQYLQDTAGGGDGIGAGGGVASSSGGIGSFASANDVVAMDQAAALAGSMAGKQGIAEAVGLMMGNPLAAIAVSQLAGPALGFMGNQAFNSFNQGIDFSNQSFNNAAMLGGLGTFSNAAGNVGTFSNQGLIDAYDMANFGVTGAGLAGSGVDGGFGFGGVNASDTGGLGFGGGSLGGFADGGFGGGDSGSSGASEGADGSPGGGY